MDKKYNIKATFERKSHIFQCKRAEFFNEAAKYFDVDLKTIDFYSLKGGVLHQITESYEIFDLMKVEICRKNSYMVNGRNLRSSSGNGLTKKETLVQRITVKLKNNSVLTGEERKHLLNMLQNDAENDDNKKRKHDDDFYGSKPKMISKRVQVYPSTQSSRDSFTQTDILEEESNDQSQNSVYKEKAIIAIKKMSCNDKREKNDVKLLMDETYDTRRMFIMAENPLVVVIKDYYPLLFNIDEVKNELDRLFYQGKCKEFLENIDKYSKVILDLSEPTDELFIRTMKCINKATTKEQKNYAKSVGSILLVSILMKEDLDFITYDGKDCPKELYPYIDASLYSLSELFSDTILYKIIVEERQLCEAPDFKEAILCLMASFFIFNIKYPENCMQTLIIFEKLYLCANDTDDDLIDSNTQQMIKLLKYKVNLK